MIPSRTQKCAKTEISYQLMSMVFIKRQVPSRNSEYRGKPESEVSPDVLCVPLTPSPKPSAKDREEKILINALAEQRPALYRVYTVALSRFLSSSPLTLRNSTNLYSARRFAFPRPPWKIRFLPSFRFAPFSSEGGKEVVSQDNELRRDESWTRGGERKKTSPPPSLLHRGAGYIRFVGKMPDMSNR